MKNLTVAVLLGGALLFTFGQSARAYDCVDSCMEETLPGAKSQYTHETQEDRHKDCTVACSIFKGGDE